MQVIHPSLYVVALVTLFAFFHIGILVETVLPGFVALVWDGHGICGFLARSLSSIVSGATFFCVHVALTYRVDDPHIRTKAQRDHMLEWHPALRARRAFTEGWRYATRLQVPGPRDVATYDAFLHRLGRTLQDDHCAICTSTFGEIVEEHEADAEHRDLYSAFVKLGCNHVYCTQCFIDWLCNGNGKCPMCRVPLVWEKGWIFPLCEEDEG